MCTGERSTGTLQNHDDNEDSDDDDDDDDNNNNVWVKYYLNQ